MEKTTYSTLDDDVKAIVDNSYDSVMADLTTNDKVDLIALTALVERLNEAKKQAKLLAMEAEKEAKKAEAEKLAAEAKKAYADLDVGAIITFTMKGKSYTLPIVKKNASTFTVEADFGTSSNKRYIKFEKIESVSENNQAELTA